MPREKFGHAGPQPTFEGRAPELPQTTYAQPARQITGLAAPGRAALAAFDDVRFERREAELMVTFELEESIQEFSEAQLELRFRSTEARERGVPIE
jgi:hypothetical protein